MPSKCAECRWGTGKNHQCSKIVKWVRYSSTIHFHKCKHFEPLKK